MNNNIETLLPYKLSVDLVKNLIKYQNNVEKGLRYNEYAKIISLTFLLIDSIYESNNNSMNLLHSVKLRIQILTEMEYIKIKFATMLIDIINKIEKELLSQDKTA